MKTAAVIAEYNPFHNGHAYQLRATREDFGAECIVAVMSGWFVQRGECACLPPQVRAKAALSCGADIVVELPLPWALSSAYSFALGGVTCAAALGCSMLSFGSECGDISLLNAAANALSEPNVRLRASQLVREGFSFAASRETAARELFPAGGWHDLLSSPNDTLGIEYILAARSHPELECVAVTRVGSAHDSGAPSGAFSSASALRAMLAEGAETSAYMPPESARLLEEYAALGSLASMERLERPILAALRRLTPSDFAALPEVSEGQEHRFYRAARSAGGLIEFGNLARSRRCPLSRVRRTALHAYLGVTRELCAGEPPYLRVLGFNERGRQLLAEAKLPLVTRFSEAGSLSERARAVFETECRSADLWALGCEKPAACGAEQATRLIYDKAAEP